MKTQFHLKKITLLTCVLSLVFICSDVLAKDTTRVDRNAGKQHVGKAGSSGWRVNIIQSDPHDHGPDGFNPHDWDGDGDVDVFVNFEEGGYSRLWFENPKNSSD